MKPALRKGFSLIEILIVVAVASTIIFVVSGLDSNTNILNTLVSRDLQTKSNIDQVLQTMTTAIRSATQSANGAYPIIAAGTSSLTFYTNGDNNGAVEWLQYYLASSSIYAASIQPSGTPATYATSSMVVTDLIDSVIPSSSALFLYYNDSYVGPTSSPMTSTTDVTPIRLVRISFFVTASSSQTPLPQYESRLINIRNLRDQP